MKTHATLAAGGLLLCAASLPASPSRPFEVPLRVEESAQVPRQAEPISGGVPLPRGRFRKGTAFALWRDGARAVPCQVTPLVVAPDGTLRWILLDFQDDAAAGATNRYVLREGAGAERPAPRLTLHETEAEIAVDTGPMRLAVSRAEPFGLFRSVEVEGRRVVRGGRVRYVQLHGRKGWDDRSPWKARTLRAGPPEAVEVVYRGALRATIAVRGAFADDPLRAGYRAWITTWAGSTRVHVKYKLCNSNPDRYTLIAVRSSTIAIELSEPFEEVLLGADRPIAASPGEGAAWLAQGLLSRAAYQDIPEAAKAGAGEEVLWTGRAAAGGWIAARGKRTVFVADKTFATDPARRLAAGRNTILLEGIAEAFPGVPDRKRAGRSIGRAWTAEGRWLFDCTHHSSEYLIDFAAPSDAGRLDGLARASRNRLWVLAPGEHYSACEAVGTGRFGTLEDEKSCYRLWGWSFAPEKVPDRRAPLLGAFQGDEDNHYESEADSVAALLLMYLRTGQRGWFDLGEAWARYHMDLEAWRTDGWRWKDGAIWFPSGGPQGNRPRRAKWSFAWGPDWGARKGNPDCRDLWLHARSKSCYCHFYGSGLADYFCLTGDRDALEACLDDVEQKDEEFRRFRNFTPGKSAVGSIRGFGRGFEVAVRVHEVVPGNAMVRDLCRLCARTLWKSPLLDERGFHPSRVGGGFGGMPADRISPPMRRWMEARGISFTTVGGTVDTLRKGDRTWKVRCFGGTWMHVYVQNGADHYARAFDDEDMRDFAIAFGQFAAKNLLSPKCHQTWYYTYLDVPDLGMIWDPWAFEHTGTRDGEGCVHSGWYTRFFPDACAKAYAWTGEARLLERARAFWYYGSRRDYRTKHLRGGPKEVHRFASHVPPKDDQVLEVSRLFHEAAHPRRDAEPPEPIADLEVEVRGDRAMVRFTAPADRGGGRVARYQVKCAPLPIVPYEEFDYARDAGVRRNWWRATNLEGEPVPQPPGRRESFPVTGVPPGACYFAVRSFDESWNRSAIGRVVQTR